MDATSEILPTDAILGVALLVVSIAVLLVLWIRARRVVKQYWAEVAEAGGVDPSAEPDPLAESQMGKCPHLRASSALVGCGWPTEGL